MNVRKVVLKICNRNKVELNFLQVILYVYSNGVSEIGIEILKVAIVVLCNVKGFTHIIWGKDTGDPFSKPFHLLSFS